MGVNTEKRDYSIVMKGAVIRSVAKPQALNDGAVLHLDGVVFAKLVPENRFSIKRL